MSGIQRREFLKGAAVTVGAAAMGVGPGAVLARAADAPAIVPTLSYWDGTRFVLAQRLRSGDASLGGIAVELQAYGGPGRLTGVDHVVTIGPNSEATFMAWTASPRGASWVKFVAEGSNGLRLRIRLVDGVVDFPLVTGSGSARKLREGVYMLAFGATSGYVYAPNEEGEPVSNGIGPRGGEYLIIQISRS